MKTACVRLHGFVDESDEGMFRAILVLETPDEEDIETSGEFIYRTRAEAERAVEALAQETITHFKGLGYEFKIDEKLIRNL